MNATIHTLTIIDTDGRESTTTIHPTLAAAEQSLRAGFDPAGEHAALDLLDLMAKVEEVHWKVVAITSHPLRSVATDLTGIDHPLLTRQARDLATIIGRCDDDADNTIILITHDEAESLEGVLSLILSILENPAPTGI